MTTDPKVLELLPCPFCGADADTPENIATSTQRARWMVSCSQHCVSLYRSTRAEVVKSWNSRSVNSIASVESSEDWIQIKPGCEMPK